MEPALSRREQDALVVEVREHERIGDGRARPRAVLTPTLLEHRTPAGSRRAHVETEGTEPILDERKREAAIGSAGHVRLALCGKYVPEHGRRGELVVRDGAEIDAVVRVAATGRGADIDVAPVLHILLEPVELSVRRTRIREGAM